MKKAVNIFFVLQVVISIGALLGLIYVFLKPVGIPGPGYNPPFSFWNFSSSLLLISYIPVTIVSLLVSVFALRNKDIPRRKPITLLFICLIPALLLIAINLINL